MLKQKFNDNWEMAEATGFFGMRFAEWQPVTLPHDLSITKPSDSQSPTGSGGGYAWSGAVTYRKRFHAPEEWQGQNVQLEFEGVYMNAEVSINGEFVRLQPYGYTSFHVDLTHHLHLGKENEVTVVANTSAQPNSRWYSGAGIYRHVWLRIGGRVHIAPWGHFVTTPVVDPAESQVSVAIELVNDHDSEGDVLVRSTVLDGEGTSVAQTESSVRIEAGVTTTINQRMAVSQPALWSINAPNLYTARSEVLLDGVEIDRDETRFGIRAIAVDTEQGFRLNGEPMKLKGGCVHHDNGLLGAASYDRAEERKVELMKSAGFNAVRCAHNPPAPAFLDACDRLGMLVINETFDCWRIGKNINDYHLYFEDWWQRDTEALVRRDRNHPSIIMWSIGNEVPERTGISDGVEWCRVQADCVRTLDDTRFVTSALPALFEEMGPPSEDVDMETVFELLNSPPDDAQGDPWGTRTQAFCDVLDVVGYNYLSKRYEYDVERFKGRVICGEETFPHQAFASWDATIRAPAVIGDFVWTALDYLGEAGIGKVYVDEPLTFAAQHPYHLANCGDFDICGFKRPQSFFRDILWGVRTRPYIGVLDPLLFGSKISFTPWGWEPVIDSWTFPGQEGKQTEVHVYSADDEVELLVNGVSVGRKPAGAHSQNKAVFQVVYQPGQIEAIGYADGLERNRMRLNSAGEPAGLRLTPDRPVIAAETGDLVYVTVEVVDALGERVCDAEHDVHLEIEGAGEIIAVGTANPMSEELYSGDRRKAYQGRLMTVVRSTGSAGKIRLTATAEGLGGAVVVVDAAKKTRHRS
jgi:beta-galactosidase